MIRNLFGAAVTIAPTCVAPAFAAEYPIGEPHKGGGLEVAAVYLQPIVMKPGGMMTPAAEADIHALAATSIPKSGSPRGSRRAPRAMSLFLPDPAGTGLSTTTAGPVAMIGPSSGETR